MIGRWVPARHWLGRLGALLCLADQESRRAAWTPIIATTALFALYEVIKEISKPELTKWQSHAVSTLVVAIIAVVIVTHNARRALAQARELRRKATALDAARARAEATDQAKSQFLANVSHEVRTPLTAILGYADMLSDPDLSPCHLHDAVATIRRNGDHLLTLVNEILDLSRIEAGHLELDWQTCSPAQLLADVGALMLVRAKVAGLTLRLTGAGPLPATIRTDPHRLRQVLINLLGNSIKFTPAGEVHVTARCLDCDTPAPMLAFDVADTGIGMTPTQAARVFQPFIQADTSTSRQYGGTGLGLAISQRLAELLGGGLEIVRTAPGEGTLIRATFATGPLTDVTWVEPNEIVSVSAATPSTNQHSDTARRSLCGRVLLAEDSPDIQRLVSHVLTRAGARVTLASDGREAVAAALAAANAGTGFDVILMDMQMPVMDGYTATRRLREQGYTGPIIALTANAMATDRARCIEAGADDYVSKPIERQALLDAVRRHTAPGANSSRFVPAIAQPDANPAHE